MGFPLEMFEAGLFPGMVYVLICWYRPEECTLRIALILASATLGGALGGAIAYGVGKMHGVHALEVWRYLFLIAGAVLVRFFFSDYRAVRRPNKVRELAMERIEGVASLGHQGITCASCLMSCFSPRCSSRPSVLPFFRLWAADAPLLD